MLGCGCRFPNAFNYAAGRGLQALEELAELCDFKGRVDVFAIGVVGAAAK